MVSSLERLSNFPWTGHRALLGLDTYPWQSVQTLMAYWGSSDQEAQSAYLAYLRQGLEQENSKASDGVPVPLKDELTLKLYEEKKVMRTMQDKRSLASYTEEVAKMAALSTDQLISRNQNHTIVRAKAMLIYKAHHERAYTLTELAQYLNMSVSAASRAYQKQLILRQKVSLEVDV